MFYRRASKKPAALGALTVVPVGSAGPQRNDRLLRFYPGHADVFDGHIVIQAILGTLPAIPGFLYPAERRHHVRDKTGIYADHSEIQRLSYSPDSANVRP